MEFILDNAPRKKFVAVFGNKTIKSTMNGGGSGSRIYSGEDAPDNALGKATDIYINELNFDYYYKVGTAWELRGNLSASEALLNQLNGKENSIEAGTSSQYFRGDKTFQELNKAAVGLGNADNTADSSKNVFSATKLATPRTINGVNFDGTSNITVTDPTKEPVITGTTDNDYWAGNKTWINFGNTVRTTVLTGLSLITSSAIIAADTILVALGKLQAQINAQSVLIANKQDNILPGTVNDYWRGDKTWQPSSELPVSAATLAALSLKQNSSLSPLRIRGRWHIPSEFGFALGTGSLTLNTIFGLAVRFTEPTTISDLGFIASSGVAGALANIGIYDSDTNGEPANLVASASNINCTSSGSKSVTLATPVALPVGKYWFVILSSATLNVTSSGISSLAVIGNATLVATTVTGITKALAFTSLPASFGAYTTTAQANIPFVWFKTA
jgi:hypothetical protein